MTIHFTVNENTAYYHLTKVVIGGHYLKYFCSVAQLWEAGRWKELLLLKIYPADLHTTCKPQPSGWGTSKLLPTHSPCYPTYPGLLMVIWSLDSSCYFLLCSLQTSEATASVVTGLYLCCSFLHVLLSSSLDLRDPASQRSPEPGITH